ncbi:unnamed protein product [Arabidopsis lyrata]|uniref:DNA topoisomerase (ATP-hydrolyzing) n=1 Tax=Arabidopsis lyrata subsp. lyrata TaxID=81972 RepID=D7M0B3_ARALL|nr:predicted protein [Arabidopsis lyrata subsp. lyrata]CAH8273031.1 unnamed protein product [Arabidopsis lyrata]
MNIERLRERRKENWYVRVKKNVGLEHTAHHHCEQILSRTIIRMAQNFVGNNNVNMLRPIGVFGLKASEKRDIQYVTNVTAVANPPLKNLKLKTSHKFKSCYPHLNAMYKVSKSSSKE